MWASSPAENVSTSSGGGPSFNMGLYNWYSTQTHTHLSLKVMLRSDGVSWAHLKGEKCRPLIRPFWRCQRETEGGAPEGRSGSLTKDPHTEHLDSCLTLLCIHSISDEPCLIKLNWWCSWKLKQEIHNCSIAVRLQRPLSQAFSFRGGCVISCKDPSLMGEQWAFSNSYLYLITTNCLSGCQLTDNFGTQRSSY